MASFQPLSGPLDLHTPLAELAAGGRCHVDAVDDAVGTRALAREPVVGSAERALRLAVAAVRRAGARTACSPPPQHAGWSALGGGSGVFDALSETSRARSFRAAWSHVTSCAEGKRARGQEGQRARGPEGRGQVGWGGSGVAQGPVPAWDSVPRGRSARPSSLCPHSPRHPAHHSATSCMESDALGPWIGGVKRSDQSQAGEQGQQGQQGRGSQDQTVSEHTLEPGPAKPTCGDGGARTVALPQQVLPSVS